MSAAVSLVTRACELDGAIRSDVRLLRSVQSRMGRALLELEGIAKQTGFVVVGSTTFSLYCEGAGLAAVEGAQYRDAARACAASPELDRKVALGEISVPKAAAAAPIVTNPVLQKPGESVDDLFAGKTTREVQREVHKRKEEARVHEPPIARTFWLTRKALDDFGRARDLVSASERQRVSDEKTLEVLTDEYLDRHDRERKLARAQEREQRAAERKAKQTAAEQETRQPARHEESRSEAKQEPKAPEPPSSSPASPSPSPTSSTSSTPSPSKPPKPASRHIPAAEQRKILARQGGDNCAIAGCDERSFLQFAHGRKPFRWCGPNNASNVGRLCDPHHAQYDAGMWKVVRGADGWILVDVRGVKVGRLRAPP